MSFWDILYKLILGPIELLLDVVFSLAKEFTGSPVLSIVVLSLAINLLVLPLYKKADDLQKEEQAISKRLKPRIDQIKEAFTGDERFMMLQTWYRQNHYKPWYALRGSLSLLLQIPFFMAAYNFLSNLQALRGVSFGPIADLAAPDAMLSLGSVTVNVLPILMTVINIVSGMIYTRGMPLKSKIQLYGMALIFLVLLYDSPAGLVFYWTLNNLFSLGKNILSKLKRPSAKAKSTRRYRAPPAPWRLRCRDCAASESDLLFRLRAADDSDRTADSLRPDFVFPRGVCGAERAPVPAGVCISQFSSGRRHLPDLERDLLSAGGRKAPSPLCAGFRLPGAGGGGELYVLRHRVRKHLLPPGL